MHKMDLADVRLSELAGLADRIVKLLEKPQTKANQALVAVLDDLLGAIYALISAREGGFKGKSRSSEFKPILERAKEVANGDVKTDGNWMAGFHFNSAIFRISAVFDRLPKAVACCHLSAKSAYLKKNGGQWKNTDAHAIREEVNRLKHTPKGLFTGRLKDFAVGLSAVKQLLELAETLA
jgi:hypothetical protein